MPDPEKGIAGWTRALFRFGGLGTAPTVAHSDVVTSSLAGSGVATTAARSDAITASGALVVGEMRMYGGAVAPTGWLFCDGSVISRTTYAALFAAIGTVWGAGDGTTTFGIPDMRGKAPIGVGTGTGLTARALGAYLGTETVTLTTAQMPAHSHDVQRGGTGVMQSGANLGISQSSGSGFGGTPNLTENTGGGGSHPIMQPSAAVNFIIKT